MSDTNVVYKPLSSALILLMSIASGLAVASNYYAQPLLHTIAQHLGLSTGTADTIVITAQLNQGAGLLLLVPLGDLLEQRRLISIMTRLSALGLLISAFSPWLRWRAGRTAGGPVARALRLERHRHRQRFDFHPGARDLPGDATLHQTVGAGRLRRRAIRQGPSQSPVALLAPAENA